MMFPLFLPFLRCLCLNCMDHLMLSILKIRFRFNWLWLDLYLIDAIDACLTFIVWWFWCVFPPWTCYFDWSHCFAFSKNFLTFFGNYDVNEDYATRNKIKSSINVHLDDRKPTNFLPVFFRVRKYFFFFEVSTKCALYFHISFNTLY